MRLKPGDVLVCGPETGCGIKVVVIEGCEELDCDLKCCGQDMKLAQKKADAGVWKQYAKESDSEEWRKYTQEKEE